MDLVKIILSLSLAFIMFTLGLGLKVEDFKRVLQKPFSFFIGAVNQVVLLPFVALALAIIFQLPPELAVGFMILSFCPGGVTTNILTKLAKGDVALSVSLTGIVSLISIITVPILVIMSVSYFMGTQGPDVNITSLASAMFLITAVPVGIGVAIRHFSPEFSIRLNPVLSKFAVGLFVIIILGALYKYRNEFIANIPVLGPALVALNIILLALGATLARLTGLTWAETKTIAIETGIQNGTLGITVGALIAGSGEGLSSFAMPSAVYGITMYLVTVPFIFWARKDR